MKFEDIQGNPHFSNFLRWRLRDGKLKFQMLDNTIVLEEKLMEIGWECL